MINISIDISTKKKYNAIVKRNLTHQFQILSNSTLKLLKFHFPPISSSSSLYPLFFPYLNLPYFLPNIPSPFANFFTNSPLPSFFFFFLSNFPSSLPPSLSPQLQYYAHVRTQRWIVILWRPGFLRELLTPHRIYTIFRISTLGHFAD